MFNYVKKNIILKSKYNRIFILDIQWVFFFNLSIAYVLNIGGVNCKNCRGWLNIPAPIENFNSSW